MRVCHRPKAGFAPDFRRFAALRPVGPTATVLPSRSSLKAKTMTALILLIARILDFYSWVVIAWVVLSWLISFNVVNTRNRFVYVVSDVLYRVTEPALRPLRRILPNLGGLDLSPLVLLLIIWFLKEFLVYDLFRYLA
jgi:YggT family protein